MHQESSQPDKQALSFPSLLSQGLVVSAKAQMSSITHLQLGTSSNYHSILPDILRKKNIRHSL